ncbi:LPP20 family lipoprotein [Vibrio sp. 16]|uniref:LPP20 family lipoprotein n=1 Tax=Vibrio sp. 16 TaxID=391586 RepID=UPI00018F3ACA|nr:LPP20 family lipoprotein [Vibrio sp. 16]EED28474.1 conserved hypothetical protein [Vibrio sp. 16]CAK4074722.1 hypothetical protein VDT1_3565 [Vibrio sp. 16]
MSFMRRRTLVLIQLASASFLTGCQTTKPDWYLNPKVSSDQYLYSVAQARNLPHAKKIAVSNINESLWTQVDSSTYIREVFKESSNNSSINNLVDNKINTQTESLTLNGIEFVKIEENELGSFVEVRIKKSSIIEQLKRELREMNQKASMQLLRFDRQDRLLWWLENSDARQLHRDALVRISMLAPLDPSFQPNISQLSDYVALYEQVVSSFYFGLQSDSQSRLALRFIGEQLSEFNIATDQLRRRGQTHVIKVTGEKRSSELSGNYISTIVYKIKVKDIKNRTISSNEIISTGNSVLSYKYADEGAARHLNEQINEKGIWNVLGLNN